MTQYETEQLLTTTIHILSKDIYRTKNVDGLILHNLKKSTEGCCGKSGYIVFDSTSIVQRSAGTILTLDGENVIQYNITYKVTSINPKKNDIYECVVDSITKMGLIAYLDVKGKDYDTKSSPILFIIPQEYLGDHDIDTFNEGRGIRVKILETRKKYRSIQIQAVAAFVEFVE